MKTIGLLGGMGWESALGYYRAINEGVKARLGGTHSAKIAMYSVDFYLLEELGHAGDWAGAEAVVLGCTEFGMLVSESETDVRLFDTTAIHAAAAVKHAMR